MTCVCNHDDCILCEGQVFNGLASDQVCQVRGLLPPAVLPARAMLFHEHTPAERFFILKSGCVKLTTALSDGREQVLRLALPGQTFGFESLNDRAYPYSAIALTEASVCAVRHRDMLRILEQNPGVALGMVPLPHDGGELARAC